MKYWKFLIIFLLINISCATIPSDFEEPEDIEAFILEIIDDPAIEIPVIEIPVEEEAPPPAPPEPEEEIVNEYGITEEEFEAAKFDIQQLIERLNSIIKAGNYNTWLTYLTEEYRTKINSRDFLNDLVTRYPVYKGRLNTGRDYFSLVVVPSRANDHVDDIEYISETNVLAYTLSSSGQRLVLYELVHFEGRWFIVR